MAKNSSFDARQLYMIPLGGSGEIGMNLNVYAYGGRLLVVDTGVTFEKLPGIEVVMPDISWLASQQKHLAGIVLTHAHEDHVGAAGHLWSQLGAPFYATPFTSGLLAHKLREAKVKAPVHQVPLEGVVDIGPFKVSFLNLTHSIPEPSALAIQVESGVVVHTGDWKIDPEPVVGAKTSDHALKALGKSGVLGLVCDSTCVFEEGWSGSEQGVQDFLVTYMKTKRKGRVVMACFASNVARLMTCYKAAKASGRQVVLAGRSLERMNEIARKTGYLDKVPPFLKDSEAKNLAPEKTLIVATGSQGEERAALMRMAFGHHPKLKLESGDTVVFSSRIIPGNEKEIFKLQNQLVLNGIEVVTQKQHPEIHVSGHPSRDELKEMYGWLKPKIAIPVHGEDRHLIEHARLAESLGCKALAPHNGDVIKLDAKKGPIKVGRVPFGRVGLDGVRLIPLDGKIVEDRKRLGAEGVISVAVLCGEEDQNEVMLSVHGLCEAEEESQLIEEWREVAERAARKACAGSQGSENFEARLSKNISKALRDHVSRELGKRPVVLVHVLT